MNNSLHILTDAEIQALWDEACKDSPQAPGWNRHIRFARALLSRLRAPVADTLPLEAALHVLVDKIVPGLDTGDLVHDAGRASAMLSGIMASAPVAGEAQRESEALRQARHDSANAKTERERVLALAGWLDRQKFEPEMLSCAAATLRAMLYRDAAPQASTVAGEAVYTLRVRGAIQAWTPTAAAFSIPDGEHQLFLSPAAPQASAEDVRNAALVPHRQEWANRGDGYGHWVDVDEARFAVLAPECRRTLYLPQADKDGGQQRAGDDLPAFMQSRMTPWGLLVRAGRIILGTTLMDMSKALGMRPSELSAYECDRQRLTDDVILAVMRFFDERGLCIPATAWRKAALSAPQAEQGERDA